jgi:type IV pilus assembly protein PilX
MKNKNKKNQLGATLVVGLILLLVMTLIGVTSMKTTALEEKMAGSLRNNVLAQSGVESALRHAENFLWSYFADSNGLELIADESATFGVYTLDSPQALTFRQSKQWVNIGTEHTFDFTTATGNASLASRPRYVIEEINTGSDGNYFAPPTFGYGGGSGSDGNSGILRIFRITARSFSGDGKIIAKAESIFSTRTK